MRVLLAVTAYSTLPFSINHIRGVLVLIVDIFCEPDKCSLILLSHNICIFVRVCKQIQNFYFFIYLFTFRAALTAHGSPQARGRIGTTSASLCHSHSNRASELHLQPTAQLTATLDPQSTERSQGQNLYLHGYQSDSFPLSHNGNSPNDQIFKHLCMCFHVST